MYDKKKYVVSDDNKYHFNTKVRWANVGWHYDWELRQYLDSNTYLTPQLQALINQHVT